MDKPAPGPKPLAVCIGEPSINLPACGWAGIPPRSNTLDAPPPRCPICGGELAHGIWR